MHTQQKKFRSKHYSGGVVLLVSVLHIRDSVCSILQTSSAPACKKTVPGHFGPATSVRGGCVSGPPLGSERGAFQRAQVRFGMCSGAFRVRRRFPHGASTWSVLRIRSAWSVVRIGSLDSAERPENPISHGAPAWSVLRIRSPKSPPAWSVLRIRSPDGVPRRAF